MKKIGILLLVLVVALGSVGVGYAMWWDTVHIDVHAKVGEVALCFEQLTWTWTDHGEDYQALGSVCSPTPSFGPITLVPSSKNVGSIVITSNGCDEMTVTIDNAYPYYYNHVGFYVKNTGTIPLKFWKLVLSAGANTYTYYDNPVIRCLELGNGTIIGPDLLIRWGNNWGGQVEPGGSLDFSFDVVVLQAAPQSSTMSFTLTLYGVQWNEYVKGPIPGY